MKRRISAFIAVAVLACFPLASPLRACCDDAWSCIAAVASGGLTCAVESLVNTVRTLIDNVGRLVATLASQVSDVVNLARTELGNAANDIRGLASQAESDFNAAAQLAATVVNDASRPAVVAVRPGVTPPTLATGAVPGIAVGAVVGGAAKGGGASVGKPSPGVAKPVGGGMGAAPAGNAMVGGASAPVSGVIAQLPADPKDILEALRRAKDAVDGLRPDITAPLNQVRQFAGQAEQQVANAVGSAASIAENALMAPLRVLGNMLNDLVAHPERIFDPGSIVDDAINQVTTQVIATMNQVHDAVMSQARGTLNLAHQPLQDLLDRSATAKKVADAMQKLEKNRNKAALEGLNKVMPTHRGDSRALVTHVALATHSTGIVALDLNKHKTMIAAPFARLDAAKLTARVAGTQMNSKLKGPWAEFKRLKAAPVKLDPSAKPKMEAEIARRFAGKTAAESAEEKRAMLAEARVRFGKDPELLRKVLIVIEGHPVINGRLGARDHNQGSGIMPPDRPSGPVPAVQR
jgi:hypothetical protein